MLVVLDDEPEPLSDADLVDGCLEAEEQNALVLVD